MVADLGRRGAPDRASATKATRRLGTLLAVVLMGLSAPVAANADPIADKRAEAQRVRAQIRAANVDLERAVEAWNLARIRLNETKGKIADNEARLRLARANLKAARADLQASLVASYKGDRPDALQAVLSASSLTQAMDQVEVMERANRFNSSVLTRITTYKAEIVQRKLALERERRNHAQRVAEQAQRRAAIGQQLRERESIYANLKSDIRRLIAEQQARERAEAARREAAARAAMAAARQSQATVAASGVGGMAGSSAGAPAEPSYTAPPPSGVGAAAANIALGQRGVPYVWGGASPGGFDCSGLVVWAFAQAGVGGLPHYTGSLWGMGSPVSSSDLAPGDLVFFNGLGHMGIYIGGGAFVHAPHSGDVVKVSSLSGYYASTYVGARRITG